MSRDSNYTYIHTHASHHADLFEDFCRPPSTTTNQSQSQPSNQAQTSTNANSNPDPGMVQIPGHFLPFEEIQLPQHLMPLNPEDEEGVVPDMHAAFGIQRALAQDQGPGGEAGRAGAAREPIWRDLGLDRLLESGGGGSVGGVGTAVGRREGKKEGILLLR